MVLLPAGSLFLILVSMSMGLTYGRAQTSAGPEWHPVGACSIRFLIPKDLKNQHARGIDSCVAEYRNKRMRLAIDAGGFGGGDFNKTESMLDFKVETLFIDGRKVQINTYKEADLKSKRRFKARLYVVLHEANPKDRDTSAFLYMTVEGRSEKELEEAKQIFLSIHFDPYKPFLIEWYNNLEL